MPTITVYVSDEAEERINKWRGELNLSELARRAIMAEIERLESLPKAPDDLTRLAARLREEKAKTENESYQAGYTCGMNAASKWDVFDYAAFVELDRRADELRSWNTWFTERAELPESVREWLEENERELREEDRLILEGQDEEEWLRGFTNAALSVWWEVQGQV